MALIAVVLAFLWLAACPSLLHATCPVLELTDSDAKFFLCQNCSRAVISTNVSDLFITSQRDLFDFTSRIESCLDYRRYELFKPNIKGPVGLPYIVRSAWMDFYFNRTVDLNMGILHGTHYYRNDLKEIVWLIRHVCKADGWANQADHTESFLSP